jgi:hypothetical protein
VIVKVSPAASASVTSNTNVIVAATSRAVKELTTTDVKTRDEVPIVIAADCATVTGDFVDTAVNV